MSKSTLRLVIAALVISFVAMGFAIIDFYGDSSWEKEQLTVLKEIRDK